MNKLLYHFPVQLFDSDTSPSDIIINKGVIFESDEGGREETSRKAQTEVDGPSAERSETAQARPRPRTQPRRMEEGNHGDPPRTGIRSAKVSKGEHI